MDRRLIELVERFGPRQSILLIGDLLLDRYVYGDAERISPEAPVPVLLRRRMEERVGGAGSVAAHLSQWGVRIQCCGILGLDDAGHRVRALLQAEGIDTRGVLSLDDRPTTTKTRFIGLAQHRHRQQLMRVDDEVSTPVNKDTSEKLLERVFAAIPQVDAVCLEDYDKGMLTPDFCGRIIDAACEAGKPVFVDPARLTDYSKYRRATMLTPNRSEFQAVSGCDPTTDAIREAAPAMLKQYELDGLLVTLDRDGSLLALAEEAPQLIPTRPRAVYDNTGAGDAVLAMLVTSRIVGADWSEAARLTNIAGGLEVEKFGCVPLTRDEIVADLRIASGESLGKVRSLEQLLPEIELRKSRGETIVFTNGCFDILHAGHVRYLEQCRQHGQVLIVGMNSDASVRAQDKDTNRPILPQEQRAEVLAALQCVTYVVAFDEPTPASLIEAITPDVLVKGEDWAERGVVGREHVESRGGRVVLLPLVKGLSTTAIIDRIRRGRIS